LKGRQKELLELLERSGADLYTLLTRLTLRQDVAEELMQDLFIKLDNRKGPKNVASLDAYAYRTAINMAFDWRRRNGRKIAFNLEEIRQPTSIDPSVPEKLMQQEQLQQTLAAIEQLNKNSQEIIIMHYIQDTPYENIAAKLGKTPHQVRALCHKAVGCLRDIINTDHS
jgi:RNA polymerase sigma factor (sigma-70 family)